MFYLLLFHTRELQREEIRRTYNQYIAPLLPHTERHPIVAVSCQYNLSDRLCRNKLRLVPDNKLNDHM